MGGCANSQSDNDNGEHYKFSGEIKYKHNSECFKTLEGKILIKEGGNKKIIEIKGKTKGNPPYEREQFCFQGEESYIKDDNNIYFDIKTKKEQSKVIIIKDIILKKRNKNFPLIKGEIYYDKILYDLEMYLELKKKNNYERNTDVVVHDYFFYLKSLTDPVDIISNSVIGFQNLINTCYINSSFQILIHIKDLVKIIRKNNDFKHNIIGYINDIFDEILLKKKEYRPVINPSKFVNYFKKENPEYNSYSQMDSEMFLEELIWNINLELSCLMEKREPNFFLYESKKERLLKEYIKESEKDSHYEINDLFYVCFIHEKKCTNCKYISYYFDETTGLKLNFENINYKRTIDLDTIIKDNFKKPLLIKSSFFCQNCKNCYYIEETTRIAKLPKILIISLQKTNGENTKKIPWQVNYNYKNNLSLKDIVDFDLCKKDSGLYQLFAINNHLGYSPRSGHYFSMIRLEKLNNYWFSFNDTSADKINPPSPDLNNYVLFYKQID